MAIKAGEAYIELKLDRSKFDQELGSVRKTIDSQTANIGGVAGRGIGGVGIGAVGAVGIGVGALVSQTQDKFQSLSSQLQTFIDVKNQLSEWNEELQKSKDKLDEIYKLEFSKTVNAVNELSPMPAMDVENALKANSVYTETEKKLEEAITQLKLLKDTLPKVDQKITETLTELTKLGQEGSKNIQQVTDKLKDTAKATNKVSENAKSGTNSFKDMFSNINTGIPILNKLLAKLGPLGIALAALTFGITKALKAFSATQKESERLEKMVRATGGAAGYTALQMTKMADKMSRGTTLTDNEIKKLMGTLLVFRKVSGKTFDRAVKASMDLSSALGVDANTAALQLGRTLEAPSEALNTLSRMGIRFSKTQQEQIKNYVKQNDILKAQDVILSSIESRVSDLSRNKIDSISDQWREVKDQSSQFLATLGKIVDEAFSIGRIFHGLASSIDALNKTLGTTFTLMGMIAGWPRKQIATWIGTPIFFFKDLFSGEGLTQSFKNSIDALKELWQGTVTGIEDKLPEKPFDDIIENLKELNKQMTRIAVDKLQDFLQDFVDLDNKSKKVGKGLLRDFSFNEPISSNSFNSALPMSGVLGQSSLNEPLSIFKNEDRIISLLNDISLNTGSRAGGVFR